MSRRAALMAPWALAGGIVAACDGGSRKSPNPTSNLTGIDLIRAQATRLAPTRYVKTYKVDATGAGGAHRTFAEAYAAVARDKAARIGAAAPSQSNPWDWRLIKVAPGSYHECIIGVPPHTAIVGQGSKPEDVRVWWDGQENTFESTGRSTYVCNIQLDSTNLNPDLHAMRDNGPSGDIDMRTRQRRTVVFDSVRFTSPRTASLGKCTNDMGPRGGVSLIFRNCTFDAPGQPQSINLITSQSDAPGRSLVAFIGCTVISNHEQHPSAEWKQLSQVDAAPVGAPDFAGGRGDRFVWVDGKWDVGATHGVQALMVFPYIGAPAAPGKGAAKPSTQYIVINPGGVTGMKTVLTDKALPVTDKVPADLALPQACVSADEKAFYGTAPAGTTLWSAASSREVISVAAGQTYWVALPTTRDALCVVGVNPGTVSTTGTMAATVALDDAGKPFSDGNARTSGGAVLADAGDIPVTPRWFYPGQGRAWVGVTFSADAKVPAVRATRSAAFTGEGQPGQAPVPTNLRPVAEGTLVPRLGLVSKRPASMN